MIRLMSELITAVLFLEYFRIIYLFFSTCRSRAVLFPLYLFIRFKCNALIMMQTLIIHSHHLECVCYILPYCVVLIRDIIIIVSLLIALTLFIGSKYFLEILVLSFLNSLIKFIYSICTFVKELLHIKLIN